MSKKSVKANKEIVEMSEDKIINFCNHPVVKKLNPEHDDDCYKNTGIKFNSKVSSLVLLLQENQHGFLIIFLGVLIDMVTYLL